MAEFGTEEWIEESLAQLDMMETSRDELTASGGDPAAIAELEEEIQGLYGLLEQVAGDDDEEEEAAAEPEPAYAAEPEPAYEPEPEPAYEPEPEPAYEPEPEPEPAHAWAATPTEKPESHPWAEQPAIEPQPEAAAPPELGSEFHSDPFGNRLGDVAAVGAATENIGGFDTPPTSLGGDDDFKPKGGAMKWIALTVLLAGAGGGGFFMWKKGQDDKAAEAAAAVPTESVSIEAAVVPEDTEDVKAAVGSQVDRTAGTVFTGKKKRSGGGGGTRKSRQKKPRTNAITLGGGDDPLG